QPPHFPGVETRAAGRGHLRHRRLCLTRIFGRLFIWARRAVTGLGLLLLIVTFTPLDSIWVSRLQGPWTDARGDVLIVLSGDLLGNGMIGGASYWRGIYAAMARQEGGWRQILVAGGGKQGPTSHAIKLLLEACGVPGDAVSIEIQSNSTRENALNLKPMLAGLTGRKVLLTSDYHMYRASRVFRKLGIDVTPRPIPDAGKRAHTWISRWGAFQDLAAETAKIVYYYVRGWI